MDFKQITVVLLFLVLIQPAALASYSGPASYIAAANAQCAKYTNDLCEKSTVQSGDFKVQCQWNESLNRCVVNQQQQSAYLENLKQEEFANTFNFSIVLSLVFLVIFVLIFKFAKARALKIIYGAKLFGVLFLFFLLFFAYYLFGYIFMLPLLYAILSILALFNLKGEQQIVKGIVIVLFFLEIVVLLTMYRPLRSL